VQLNPALLRSIAPGNFEIRVPKGTGAQVTAGLDLVPTALRASSRIHRVEPGQSLASIARLYSASPVQIAMANNLKGGDPSEGDRLVVPAAYHEVIPALRTPRAGSKTTMSKSVSSTAKPHAAVSVSAHRPLHPATAALAQLKDRNRSLNR
jgi:LysM repeat protein